MNYAAIKKTDVANGLGVRVSLFVSGCTRHCPECFNKEAWDFQYGQPYTLQTEAEILSALNHNYIRGISILGGEPFEEANRKTVTALLKAVKKQFPQKDIWCYSGYELDKDIYNWIKEGKEDVLSLLQLLDVLVDGRFLAASKNLNLPFRGSENQRIIDVQETLKQKKIILYM